MSQDPHTVCLLLGSKRVPPWFAKAVQRMVKNSRAEVRLIVTVSRPESDEHKKENENRRTGLLYLAYLIRNNISNDKKQSVSLSSLDCLSNSEWIEYNLEPNEISDNRITLPNSLVETITDVAQTVIHNGVGILSGPILDYPENGVLSYHHGDIREYRGSSGGYWEFLHGKDKIGVTLQQLTEDLDAGRIVVYRSVDISDAHTFSEISSRTRKASVPMLADAIGNLDDQNFSPTEIDESELGKVYLKDEKADLYVTVKFYLKNTFGKARNYINF